MGSIIPMSYSDFSLETVQKRLSLTLTEQVGLFAQASDRPASDWLQETLAYFLVQSPPAIFGNFYA